MRIISALVATAIAFVPIAAASANDGDAPTATVSTEGLDLTTEKGIAMLDRRVQNAIRRLCTSGMRGLEAAQAERECRAAANTGAERETSRVIAAARTGHRRYSEIIVDGRQG